MAGDKEPYRKEMIMLVHECVRLGERPIVIELNLTKWVLTASAVISLARDPELTAPEAEVLAGLARELTEAIRDWSPAMAGILDMAIDGENELKRKP